MFGHVLWLACRVVEVAVLCAAFSSCAPGSGAASTTPDDRRDPIAVELLEELEDGFRRLTWRQGDATNLSSYSALVRRGASVLPTIEAWYREHKGDEFGGVLLDVAAAIGGATSQSMLRGLLAEVPPQENAQRMSLFERLYLAGDDSVLGDVLDLGLADSEQRFTAVSVVSRHAPVRRSLGLRGKFREDRHEVMDDEGFLFAAKEWHIETVLGRPSPWKPREDFTFGQPFAEEKARAFAALTKAVRDGDDECHELRVLPVEVVVPTIASLPSVVVSYGWGHGHGYVVDAWRAGNGEVRLHRFQLRRGMPCEYHSGSVGVEDYRRFCTGLSVILSARCKDWWDGGVLGEWHSTNNFAVSVRGHLHGEANRYCGHPSSDRRYRYVGLQVARDWHCAFAHKAANLKVAIADADAKAIFVSAFLEGFADGWQMDGWWWVQERMLQLSRAFGTGELLTPLSTFLQPRVARGKSSAGRSAKYAIDALAAITGVDLRTSSEGTPRPLAEVAQAYREHLGLK